MSETISSEPVIHIHHLSKTVILNDPATQESVSLDILNNVSLDIYTGESVAITGTSGSGKTTLLGIMAGLDSFTHGEVQLLQQSLEPLDENARAHLRKGSVGFVFQSFQLMEHLTALENVMLPLEIDFGQADIELRASEALERVGLATRKQSLAKQLSGGEQQRVALARAFVTQPAVLFADEPTGNLDRTTGEEIINLLFDLQKQQSTTVVLVTHDESLAARCDKHYRLQDGVISSEVAA